LQSSYFNRVIPNVRKTQHQNPEFGHTQGEIFKKPAKKYGGIQGMVGSETQKPINFGGKLSFRSLSFFLGASTAATYIFTVPNCTTTIFRLKPCEICNHTEIY